MTRKKPRRHGDPGGNALDRLLEGFKLGADGHLDLDKKRWNEPNFTSTLASVRSMSHAAAVKLLKKELSRSGSSAKGPQTCSMILELGIQQFELGQFAVAEETFKRCLRMAREIEDKMLVGGALHELSMVCWQRGDHQKSIELGRESLVQKLEDFYARARLTSLARYLKPRIEPIAAIERFVALLVKLRQWQQAESLFALMLESCQSRNDLPVLVHNLIGYAGMLSRLGRVDECERAIARAAWTGRICGIEVDILLGLSGFAFTQPELSDCPVRSDNSGRHALEQCLIKQYREIALGLLADRLIREGDLPIRTWWQQFCSQRRSAPPYLENADDEEFKSFQDEIFQAIASRQIRRINPADLLTQTVKIQGVDVAYWREGTINRYLAEIGSSLRLFVGGADVARATNLLSMLGHPPSEPIHASDFILGCVRPMSALAKAVFFDFSDEYAISPYLNPDSPALHDQGRIVLRDFLIKRCLEYNGTHTPPTLAELKKNLRPEEYVRLTMIEAAVFKEGGTLEQSEVESEQFWAKYCANLGITREEAMGNSFVGHELGHVMQIYPVGIFGPFSSWRAIMRDDICRFAQTPRTMQELQAAFRRNFEGLGERKYFKTFLRSFPPGDSPIQYPLDSIVAELCEERLLERLPDARYRFAGFVGNPENE